VGVGADVWASAGRKAVITIKITNTKKREKRFIQSSWKSNGEYIGR
jgi:hypothetical protein